MILNKKSYWLIICFLIAFGFIMDANTQRQKVVIRADKIKKQFYTDGSHRAVVILIMRSLHDPDSYEHEETKYWDKGDHLLIRTSFRGKNRFGDLVRYRIEAKVDPEGKVFQFIEQEP